jgi:prevent-host-death family protein
MDISVAEAHNRLSQVLKQLRKGPVRITRHGKPVGVIIDPEEYERLRKVQAYLTMVRISEDLQESGLKATELFQASREDLERKA